MVKYKMGFVPIVLTAIIAGGVLLAGGGTYGGVKFYQSNKLIIEADKLAREGNYAEAVEKYDGAKHKWPWAKIETKKRETEELKQLQDYNTEGDKYFGEGEWQKCLEYLGKVTSKFPNYAEVQARYSDCQKKLAEKQAAEAMAAEEAKKASGKRSTSQSATKNNSTTNSSSSSASSASGETSTATSDSGSGSAPSVAAPTLYLPYSLNGVLPSMMTPMGETIYHPKPQNPQGHPGIDFQWENPNGVPTITASMEATVISIIDNTSHAGTYDVKTAIGQWGVDYCELGGVRDGLKVGDTVRVGDTIGTPQHPSNFDDLPNFRMIHWQFGYATNAQYGGGVGTRLCPLSYFDVAAKSAIETLWANTNSPELKANAPNICSGDFAE